MTPLKENQLDGHSELFGWKFGQGENAGLISIYIEDDEYWHEQMSFANYWLKDFKRAANLIPLPKGK